VGTTYEILNRLWEFERLNQLKVLVFSTRAQKIITKTNITHYLVEEFKVQLTQNKKHKKQA